ncbi:MAG: hypothetical protein Q7R98_02460 [Candidatus Jorgensenbacteria bacterium]|nr:hypothetical protein [Candidatus Jorgensenbacteria bacterium]
MVIADLSKNNAVVRFICNATYSTEVPNEMTLLGFITRLLWSLIKIVFKISALIVFLVCCVIFVVGIIIITSVAGFMFAYRLSFADGGLFAGLVEIKKWPKVKGHRIMPIYIVLLFIVGYASYLSTNIGLAIVIVCLMFLLCGFLLDRWDTVSSILSRVPRLTVKLSDPIPPAV